MPRIKLVAGMLAAALLGFGSGGFAVGFFNPISRTDPHVSPLCRVVVEYRADDPQRVAVMASGSANPIARCPARGDRIALGVAVLQFLSGD